MTTSVAPETVNLTPVNANPWYLLATLHGEPTGLLNDDLIEQNRVSWNRWMAAGINEGQREQLIASGRYSQGDLTIFDEHERAEVQKLFAVRAAGRSDLQLPSPRQEIYFDKSIFETRFNFEGYLFPTHLHARGSRFEMLHPFSDCDFFGLTDFSGSSFGPTLAEFSNNRFHNSVQFNECVFLTATSFRHTEFNGCGFYNASFMSHVDFFFLRSNDFTYFDNVKFFGPATFENAEFKMRLSFADASFARPPLFLNSKLPEGLNLGRVHWPVLKKGDKDPEEFLQAYQRLKVEMDRQRLHQEEMMFFGYEMQCRRVMARAHNDISEWLATAIYGATSDYGRSYVRPLVWLIGIIGIFWALNWVFRQPTPTVGEAIWTALGHSVVDAFRPFGVGDEFKRDASLPMLLRILSVIETIVASALLFLSILALQKRCRMK